MGCIGCIDTNTRQLYESSYLCGRLGTDRGVWGADVYTRGGRSICQAGRYTVKPFVYNHL